MVTHTAHRVAGRYLAAKLPRQLLDERTERAVVQLQRLMMRVRVQPEIPAHVVAPELKEIVELLEGMRSASFRGEVRSYIPHGVVRRGPR